MAQSYSYHESTTLSQQNALALRSLAATGELPNNHYWNTLRSRHDANPTRFDRGNVVLAALLDRDQLQRQGILSAFSPLFSRATGFFQYADAKHTLDITRFDHYHPFLGRLLEITLPQQTTAGEGLTPTPTPVIIPPGNLNPSPFDTNAGGGGGGGGGSVPASGGTGAGGGGSGVTPDVTPEPASVILMSIGLLGAIVCVLIKRRWHRADPANPAQPALA